MTDAGAVLAEILIDDATWESASPERRREWLVVLGELQREHRFGVAAPAPLRLLVSVQPGRILCDARTTTGVAFARCDVTIAEMETHLREYFEICRDMGSQNLSANSPRLEALDIAKRLVHDEAAETLQHLCGALRPDHATARRLFTLLVTLHFDTTQLVRPHHLDATLGRARERAR